MTSRLLLPLVRARLPTLLPGVPTVKVPAETLKLLDVTAKVLLPVLMVLAAPAVRLMALPLCRVIAPEALLPIPMVPVPVPSAMWTLPVLVPVLIEVLKLELLFRETAAPVMVKPRLPCRSPAPLLTPTAVTPPLLLTWNWLVVPTLNRPAGLAPPILTPLPLS